MRRPIVLVTVAGLGLAMAAPWLSLRTDPPAQVRMSPSPAPARFAVAHLGVQTEAGRELAGQPCQAPEATAEETTEYGPRDGGASEGEFVMDGRTAARLASAGHIAKPGQIYAVRRDLLLYGERRIAETFECRDGRYALALQEVCTRIGMGERTNPAWFAVIDGYPMDGSVGSDGWIPWICSPE